MKILHPKKTTILFRDDNGVLPDYYVLFVSSSSVDEVYSIIQAEDVSTYKLIEILKNRKISHELIRMDEVTHLSDFKNYR